MAAHWMTWVKRSPFVSIIVQARRISALGGNVPCLTVAPGNCSMVLNCTQ